MRIYQHWKTPIGKSQAKRGKGKSDVESCELAI
jgi:hypothetical protein